MSWRRSLSRARATRCAISPHLPQNCRADSTPFSHLIAPPPHTQSTSWTMRFLADSPYVLAPPVYDICIDRDFCWPVHDELFKKEHPTVRNASHHGALPAAPLRCQRRDRVLSREHRRFATGNTPRRLGKSSSRGRATYATSRTCSVCAPSSAKRSSASSETHSTTSTLRYAISPQIALPFDSPWPCSSTFADAVLLISPHLLISI